MEGSKEGGVETEYIGFHGMVLCSRKMSLHKEEPGRELNKMKTLKEQCYKRYSL